MIASVVAGLDACVETQRPRVVISIVNLQGDASVMRACCLGTLDVVTPVVCEWLLRLLRSLAQLLGDSPLGRWWKPKIGVTVGLISKTVLA